MKRIILTLLILLMISGVAGASRIRQYQFKNGMSTEISSDYQYGKKFHAFLLKDFTARDSILKFAEREEVNDYFNLYLRNKFMEAGAEVHEFYLISSLKTSLDSRDQQGTLKIQGKNESQFIYYAVNPTEEIDVVVTGDIQFFRFNKSFKESFIALTLKMYHRDTGRIYWQTEIVGQVQKVADRIAETVILESKPIQLDTPQVQNQEEESSETESYFLVDFSAEQNQVSLSDGGSVVLNIDVRNQYPLDKWSVQIFGPDQTLIKAFAGKEEVESRIEWDLMDEAGTMVESGEYRAVFSVNDELQNSEEKEIKLEINE